MVSYASERLACAAPACSPARLGCGSNRLNLPVVSGSTGVVATTAPRLGLGTYLESPVTEHQPGESHHAMPPIGPGGATSRVIDLVRAALDPSSATTPRDAVLGVPPGSLATLFHARSVEPTTLEPLTAAMGASPGMSSGRMVLSTDAAFAAEDEGEPFILARPATTAEDVLAMRAAAGLLTAHGGLASHAAVVARGWGVPAVVGAKDIEFVEGGVRVGGRFVAEGEYITIDGSVGEVMLGAVRTSRPTVPAEVTQLLEWADDFRGGIAVRANADTRREAEEARRLGAQGVGLCRTEHMFFDKNRLPTMRAYIVSDDPVEQRSLLAELERAQVADFVEIFEAMDGLPVTVRLLDPPLHEFLPRLDDLLQRAAEGALTEEHEAQLAAVRRLHESNPMLGTRGVRLGMLRPGLYEMQVRALCRAASEILTRGKTPQFEIMIPFASGSREFSAVRARVRDVLSEFCDLRLEPATIQVGAMIETPRMALVAGHVANDADFFSFGTNDLTQLAFGLSRDDVEAELIPAYLDAGYLSANPFEELDMSGVGRLIDIASRDARKSRADIVLGMCGEHAGHPSSAALVIELGMDYISCSPYRLPAARLAIAQARLVDDQGGIGNPAKSVLHTGSAPLSKVSETVLTDVLHAVAIKGLATPEAVAKIAGTSPGLTELALHDLRDRGFLRFLPSRGLWRTTELGSAGRTERLRKLVAPIDGELRAVYDDFLPLNVQVKELCTDWQSAILGAGDHASSGEVPALLDQFAGLNARAHPVIARMSAHLPRLAGYSTRLDTAARAVFAGDASMLTGVMRDSYHDIWMEFHEDLVQLLAIDRAAEGSY